MTFEGQYLTYVEYLALGGSTMGEMPFNLLEFEARKQIDLRTFNRLKDLQNIPQEVKLCEYELINKLDSFNNTSSVGNAKSESIDGYSISYLSGSELSLSKNKEVDDIIRTYLLNVIINDEHIMYCGV